MKDVLNIQFDKINQRYLIGEKIEGEILLSSDEDIDFQEFGINIIAESRGKVGTHSIILKKQQVFTNKLILKNEDYSFPFSFRNNKIESYFGKNFSLVFKIETYGVLSKKIVNDPLKPFINPFNLIDVNKQWKESLYIVFYSKNKLYDIKESFINLDNEITHKILFGFILLSLTLTIIIFTSTEYWYFASIPLITFLVLGFYMLSSINLFGDFKAKLYRNDENSFNIKLFNTKNWNFIEKIELSYQIKEEVLDKRGTTETKYRETIFESDVKHFLKPIDSIESNFKFPKNKPVSINLIDSSIFWNLKLVITSTFGVKYTYNSIFTTYNKIINPKS